MDKRLAAGALLSASMLLTACNGILRVSAMHDPLYRAENHTSTITATASESSNGVSEIEINAVVGELTACSGAPFVLPSLIPCRTAASTVSVTCVYPNSKVAVDCALPVSISPRRLISYTATARTASGKSATTGPVSYAAGAPLTIAPYNIGILTMNLGWDTARPVIWRTDAPSSSTNRSDKIDVGFVPNQSMPNYRAFTDDLQAIVLQTYYTDTNPYSQWKRVWRNMFNFWAGAAGTITVACNWTLVPTMPAVTAAFDGTTILHRDVFRDCATISLGGGVGTTETPLADASWVYVHEAGHFLFGLGDEYEGGGNSSIAHPQNVFPMQALCMTVSTANGLPAANCVQIGTTGTWRNDDGQPTTMEDRVLSSDWRTLSAKALANQVTECITNGSCY